jgi:hypothetical protein
MASGRDNGTVFYTGMQNKGGLFKGTTVTAEAVLTTKEGKVTDRSAAVSLNNGTSTSASLSFNKPKGQPAKFKASLTLQGFVAE